MKKKIALITIVGVLLGLTVIVKPKEKEEYKDITEYNNKLALFVENEEGIYEEAQTIPTSGYTLNESKSACSNNAKPSWNISDNTLKISSLEQSSTSCYLYFRKANSVDKILADSKVNEGTPDFSQVATTDEGMFKAEDDDGTSYYYRGAVENNYVKFANKYWRIIRINGDGTIRMIYDGDTARANGSSLTVEKYAFNSHNDDNMYVGFKYTSGQVHGIGTESPILKKSNTWYEDNLASYSDKIDPNAGFCNDREPSTNDIESNGLGGAGTTKTYYGAYLRFYNGGSWGTTQTPTFKCKNSGDLFTKTTATKGNKSLTNPIGLVTADEVVYAGGLGEKENSNYYLYSGQTYWTMSPYNYDGDARVLFVHASGSLNRGSYVAWTSGGVRPVINLKTSTTFLSGDYDGSIDKPFIVKI